MSHIQLRMINRSFFLRSTALSIVALFLLLTCHSFASSYTSEGLEKNARKQAVSFISSIANNPVAEVASVSLSYEVHMVSALNIRMRMSATVKMEKEDNRYVSTFKLTEPEGKDVWSWLLLKIFGKHTHEYKELVHSIETLLIERFHLRNHKFRTDSLEEFLPSRKYYPNQTAIKVWFDYEEFLVKFWEDKTLEHFNKSMGYNGQVGPLTGFFNYLFFSKCFAKMSIVNVLKQVEDVAAPGDFSSNKVVQYFFGSEIALLGFNNTGQHDEYLMNVYLEKGNFLDIIYGNNIYYQLAHNAQSNIKVPYAARIEGIISRTKKKNKLNRMREKKPNQEISEADLFAEVDDILAARNVRVYLKDYKIAVTPP